MKHIALNDMYRCARLIAVATVLALAAACGGEQNVAALTASAKQYLERRDYAAAAIQLKNALRQQPNNAELRYLLGIALLESRDATSAEKELRKALEYGYAPERVYGPLARALLVIGDPERLVSELGSKSLADPQAQAELQASVGFALLALSKPEDAQAAFTRALQAKPDYARAKVGSARVLAFSGKVSDANQIVESVLAQSPTQPDALLLKGELLVAQGKPEDAVSVLEKLVAVAPGNLVARQALVSLLIDQAKYDAASAQLAQAKEAAKGDLQFQYLQAVLAFRQGKNAAARDGVLQVLKVAPDHIPSLVLAGTIAYQSGVYAQSQDYLRRALDRAPRQTYARRLLAASYLRLGNPDRALEALRPLLNRPDPDAATLQLAGEIYLAANDLKAAAQALEQASALDANNTVARTRLAQIRFATGDVDRAVRDLASISEQDPQQIQADIVLVLGHLRRNEADKALAAARNLLQKQPQNPLSYNLTGAAQMAQRDFNGARASFTKALELEPAYGPALNNIAALDVRQGQVAQARKRYESVLAKDSGNARVLVDYADLLRRTGADKKEVMPVLERAIANDPSGVGARLAMIDLLLRSGNPKSALVAAQQATIAIPNDDRLLDALGTAQLANGDLNQAIATFKKAVVDAPESASALMRLASAHAAAKEYANAEQALRRALALQPNLAEIYRDIASVYVQSGRPEEALAEARAMQRRNPRMSAGFLIEGDVLAVQKRWGEAANAYRAALALGKTPAVVVRLHSALASAGNAKEAAHLARTWLDENPKDVAVRAYLAQRDLEAKDYKSAVAHYRSMLDLAPGDAAVLNNLAWAAGQLNDAQAVRYAEQAYGLAPDNPAILDTLGTLLVERGDASRGVELLQKAAELAPGAHEIRLHLAKALTRAGKKEAARKELRTLLQTPSASAYKDEAAALIKSL